MHLVMDIADRVLALDFGRPIATAAPRRSRRPARRRGVPGATGMSAAVRSLLLRRPARPRRCRRCCCGTSTPAPSGGVAGQAARSVEEFSWADYRAARHVVGLGLRELGIGTGDRAAVLSENRPEWLFADLGIQGIGGVTVGVYPTSPEAEVGHLLRTRARSCWSPRTRSSSTRRCGTPRTPASAADRRDRTARGVDRCSRGSAIMSFEELEATGLPGDRRRRKSLAECPAATTSP